MAAIARLEREHYEPGAAAHALRTWSGFVRTSGHRLWTEAEGCGVPECCPNPPELRLVLHAVVAVLPPKDARVLRKRLEDLDDMW
ncbi:hypothetical protein L6E12_04900 [Actinokineospora sp. PR83]|uniref:hypothetical protein n=1 Tax=Actinokineospora sp. PR83 TaxID=2884908 RepID=UPI001F19878F|nr:hypothetical protein [Actinokineospora sp. PR83]MCG8915128.1 hypothetical protein [Actinokineospora sp. PR83]